MSKSTANRSHNTARNVLERQRSSDVAHILRTEGAVVGLGALLEIARDPDAPKGVRVDAAKALLDRAGHVAPRAEVAAPAEKMLSEMSPAELAEVIKECEDQLAANARVVQSNHSLQITEDKQLAGVTGEYLRRDVSACFG